MNFFFIALAMPSPLKVKIDWIREEIALLFNSHHALKTPPHITLQPPFKSLSTIENLNDIISDYNCFLPVHIRLSGFGFFGNKVAFINVKNQDQLTLLRAELCKRLRKEGITQEAAGAFYPHLTLAHRDLIPKQAILLKKYLDKLQFEEEVKVEKLTLYQHSGKRWLAADGL